MWEIETFGEIPAGVYVSQKKIMLATRKDDSRNVNFLVYPAISLADQISRIVQKVIFEFAQKEIIPNNLLR